MRLVKYKLYLNYKFFMRFQKIKFYLSYNTKVSLIKLNYTNFRYLLLLRLTNIINLYLNKNLPYFKGHSHQFFILKFQRFLVLNKHIYSFDKFKFIFKTRNFFIQFIKEYSITFFSPIVLSKVRRLRYRYSQQLKLIKFVLYYHFTEFRSKLVILCDNYSSKDYIFFNYFIRALNIYRRVFKEKIRKKVISLQIMHKIFFGTKKLKKFPRKKRFLIKRSGINKLFL